MHVHFPIACHTEFQDLIEGVDDIEQFVVLAVAMAADNWNWALAVVEKVATLPVHKQHSVV